MCGFQSTNQQELYERCAKGSVDDFLKGYNATVMAYGQVGAGKTFTMTGDMKVSSNIWSQMLGIRNTWILLCFLPLQTCVRDQSWFVFENKSW